MIRQAISCDICGAEKRQTNHWFVACEQAGELRVSGWSSRLRQRPGTKHLCGQTCLHKLVDEFMARTIEGRAGAAAAEAPPPIRPRNDSDASLTSQAAFREIRAQKVAPADPLPAHPPAEIPLTAVVPFPARPALEPPEAELAPQYASRRWRAEAWERERNREQRAGDRRFDLTHRRKGF